MLFLVIQKPRSSQPLQYYMMLAMRVPTLKEGFWEGHIYYIIQGIIHFSLFFGRLQVN